MIKVLAIITGETGLQYHRQTIPLVNLKDEVEVVQSNTINLPEDKWEGINVVMFLRQISMAGETKSIVESLHRRGIKVWFDIDDYWHLPEHHHMYKIYTEKYLPQQTEEALRCADHVTCTTEYLADKIREFTQEVTVVPNAIDPDQPGWHRRDIEGPRTRIGWLGGVYHLRDMQLIKNPAWALYNDRDLKGKYQICLGGFNIDTPEYLSLERMLTCDYKHLRDESDYVEYLHQHTPLMEHWGFDRMYRRIWGRSVDAYGQGYNEIDIAIAPLEDNEFTRCKSQLKMIEAGFMRKAFICSDLETYKEVYDNGLGLSCRDQKEWTTAFKVYINDEDYRKEDGERLYEYVTKHYHIKIVNKLRLEVINKLAV